MDVYDRAYVVLEILAHRVAELTGLYQEAGVEVTLREGSGMTWNAETERSIPITIGLGGAVHSRLTHGTPWEIIRVNTQHPMFWLMARPEVESIQGLRGKTVAGRPVNVPPAIFTRIAFRNHGVDLLKECTYQPMPIHSDTRLIEMLASGEADAVLLSTTPFELERAGYRILAFLGDEVSATATGLAVNPAIVPSDSDDARRLAEANRRSLQRLHAGRELAVQAIRDIEPQTSEEDAGQLYDRYIKPYWTADGRPDKAKAEASLRAVAQEMGVPAERVPTYEQLYRVI